MPKSLPALLSAAALALAPLPALAERGGNGNGRPFTEEGFCPPGLADRNPACVPPGQARGGDREEVELPRAPAPEEIIPDVVEELLRERADDDQRTDEAALIVGALLGLAAMERASREGADTGDAADPAPAPAPESIAFSEVPSRPPEIEDLSDAAFSDAALPEPEVDLDAEPAPERTAEAAVEPAAPATPAGAPMGPPVPIGEPSFDIPPPEDLARTFQRAEQTGDTGY